MVGFEYDSDLTGGSLNQVELLKGPSAGTLARTECRTHGGRYWLVAYAPRW